MPDGIDAANSYNAGLNDTVSLNYHYGCVVTYRDSHNPRSKRVNVGK